MTAPAASGTTRPGHFLPHAVILHGVDIARNLQYLDGCAGLPVLCKRERRRLARTRVANPILVATETVLAARPLSNREDAGVLKPCRPADVVSVRGFVEPAVSLRVRALCNGPLHVLDADRVVRIHAAAGCAPLVLAQLELAEAVLVRVVCGAVVELSAVVAEGVAVFHSEEVACSYSDISIY